MSRRATAEAFGCLSAVASAKAEEAQHRPVFKRIDEEPHKPCCAMRILPFLTVGLAPVCLLSRQAKINGPISYLFVLLIIFDSKMLTLKNDHGFLFLRKLNINIVEWGIQMCLNKIGKVIDS